MSSLEVLWLKWVHKTFHKFLWLKWAPSSSSISIFILVKKTIKINQLRVLVKKCSILRALSSSTCLRIFIKGIAKELIWRNIFWWEKNCANPFRFSCTNSVKATYLLQVLICKLCSTFTKIFWIVKTNCRKRATSDGEKGWKMKDLFLRLRLQYIQ